MASYARDQDIGSESGVPETKEIMAVDQGEEQLRLLLEELLKDSRYQGKLISSGVLQADTLIARVPAGDKLKVYWVSVSDTAALAIELNDSIANGKATDEWGIDIPAAAYAMYIFDPPLEFEYGIYLDVSTTTCKVTVGYK